MEVTVASVPGSGLDGRRLLRMYARTVPHLVTCSGLHPIACSS